MKYFFIQTIRSAVRPLLGVLMLSAPLFADEMDLLKKEVAELKAMVRELKNTSEKQQRIIESLSKNNAAPSMVSSAALVPSQGDSPAQSQSAQRAMPFIPEIGVVADITASLSQSKNDEEGNDRLSVREVELVMGHDIDPYSRFDSTITFSDSESPDVEEAYVSYWDLPWGLKGRFGRIRPKVGKAAALHRDALDTADEPLVVQRYFGREGLSKTGAELTGFTPLSGEEFTQQLTIGAIEGGVGEDAELFASMRRSPTLYAHLSNFFEINDTNNFELGGTYLAGANREDDNFKVHAFGVDATYNFFVTPNNKLKLLAEAYFQDRNEPGADNGAILDHNPLGFYTLVDYRINQRWGIGTRYDYVEPVGLTMDDIRSRERALSGYITFFQSEFARWRLEYQHATLLDGLDDNRVFLQGTFAIGTHKHQLQ